MKTTAKCLTYLIAPALLALVVGCKSKPVEVAVPSEDIAAEALRGTRNVFLGRWVGSAKNGDTYTIRFTNNLQWESHIEEGGVARPHYKGTYEPDGARVRLKVTEEGDLTTFGWRPERGNLPANLTGTISGSTLKVAGVLTDLELKRR